MDSANSMDNNMPSFDQGSQSGPDLREQVEEYEQLLDDLARETRRLDKPAHEELLKALKLDYKLGDQVDDMRRGLSDNEAVIDIQEAIKAQQARMKAMPLVDPQQNVEDRKLFGLQSDLITSVAGIRQRLSGQLRDLTEVRSRDLKAWLMVSAGLLRHRREDAEAAAKAKPPLETEPINASALSPTSQPEPLTASAAGRLP
jgi:hypothetical protein